MAQETRDWRRLLRTWMLKVRLPARLYEVHLSLTLVAICYHRAQSLTEARKGGFTGTFNATGNYGCKSHFLFQRVPRAHCVCCATADTLQSHHRTSTDVIFQLRYGHTLWSFTLPLAGNVYSVTVLSYFDHENEMIHRNVS